jgi:hypothetical protein
LPPLAARTTDIPAEASAEILRAIVFDAGSAVAGEKGSTTLGLSPTPQKIRRGSAPGPVSARHDSNNHLAMIANDEHMMMEAYSPGFWIFCAQV